MSFPPTGVDEDYYSASSTVVTFDRPVPLLRGPVPEGDGRFVLAFRDADSWASAYRACESKLVQQCEAGARIGCAVSASSKCKPPWWHSLLGRPQTDRGECEERETVLCLEAAKANCSKFAADKCRPVFSGARIAINHRKVDWKEASMLICWATSPLIRLGFGFLGLDQLGAWAEFKDRLRLTNFRGSELIGTSNRN
ncbi:uncharacterized protein LOC127798057 [Diospyros lotus]|uniref:uncharacterized protein LOC127798057 n=1 Tax=Diospyros lotus TaxID=55363 RepID=UPI002259DF0C|nr:uncharacterized protein LOC127798057 [Diospyros lotus]XP_052187313.1 uncharacterized protein LOC127798057 [Diospyros lotus]